MPHPARHEVARFLSPEAMGLLAPVSLEAQRGLSKVGDLAIKAADTIAPVLSNLEGVSPTLLDDGVRADMRFDQREIAAFAAFLARPLSLTAISSLGNFYRSGEVGTLADRTKELTGAPFERAVATVVGQDRRGIGAIVDRWYKTKLRGVPVEVLELVGNVPQIKGFLFAASWWAERLREATDVHEYALGMLEDHLDARSKDAELARRVLSNFQSGYSQMKEIENRMTGAIGQGMAINLMNVEGNSSNQVDAMDKVAKLLGDVETDQRAYSSAAVNALKATLTMDGLKSGLSLVDARHKAMMNLVLASLRWVAAAERGTTATFGALEIVMTGAVAEGIRIRGVMADDLAGKTHGMLAKALNTATDMQRAQLGFVNEVVASTRAGDDNGVIEGEFIEK